MIKILVTVMIVSVCLAAPGWAAETEQFNPDQPFEQALTTGALRSLLNQAFDMLEDHVEITGSLKSDALKDDKDKHFSFKFYPEGKSKSDEHLTAEGWFHSSPDAGQRDWHFRFKLPEDHPKKPLQFKSPL